MTQDLTRDPLALAMFAAWLNVQPDQIPPENLAHTNPHTMAAWKRVGEAARTTEPWLAYLDNMASELALHKAAIEATSARLDRVQAMYDARFGDAA